MRTLAILAAVLAGALVWSSPVRWAPKPQLLPGRRLGLSAVRALVLFAATLTLAGLGSYARGPVLVLGLILAAAVAGAARLFANAQARRIAERREQQVVDSCEALVGELRAGQPAVTALARCVETWQEFEPVATAARLGADVPEALRALSRRPGAGGLRNVAGAWQVAQGSGAGLAVAVAQVAESARESQSTRRLVSAELSSARATARLVAGLPLVALAMGSGLGGEPWHFLLATPAGLACLGVGLALCLTGLFWIERISAAVTR